VTELCNILTVDVEDWFQSEGYAAAIPQAKWDDCELRVQANVDRLLELFSEKNASATFFVLGWVAERLPDMVRRIAGEGHEIASHGWSHTPLWRLSRDEFADEVRRSKQLLEELSGYSISGFLVTTSATTEKTLWGIDVLEENGYLYDSSIFPVYHDRYGIPSAPLEIHRRSNLIWEIPLSVLDIGSLRLPVAGGGYFRLYPSVMTLHAIRKMNFLGRPAVVYVHPWEFDPGQPKVPGMGLVATFRHHVGIARNLRKLAKLLDTFPFAPARDVLREQMKGTVTS